jgi:hypothetical protein
MGFDIRDTGHSVRLYSGFVYKYLNRDNKKTLTSSTGDWREVAETLALSGYCVVPFVTPRGEDVDVVPDLTSPGDVVWNIPYGSGRDRHWHQGRTIQEATLKSEWKCEDLQCLSSDEYT